MKRIVTVVLFSLLISGVAGAQTWEVGAGGAYTRIGKKNLGSIADQNVQDDDTKLKAKYGYGARFTINTPGYYGHEIGYFLNYADLTTKTRPDAKAPDFVLLRQDRIRIQELSYNFLLYMMPKGERWRPFITGGAQMHRYGEPRIAEWTYGNSRNFGANYGGGIKIRLFPHALIRADFRHFFGGTPYGLKFKDETKLSGGILQQLEGSVGLSIGF
jgi:hypothetical protein